MAPAKGRGRPKKAETEEAKVASPKAAAPKSPKVASPAAKSPVAQNGAKKSGRGRPAAKVAPVPKSPAAKKEEPKATSKRKAEEEPETAPPAKSPKTESAKGRGRPPKKAAAKKPAAKSPAAKKGGRGRKPAADVTDGPEEEASPIVNVDVDSKKVSKTTKVTKKAKADKNSEPEAPKKRARAKKSVEKDEEEPKAEVEPPVKKSFKKIPVEKVPKEKAPKEKKAKAEPKPKLNKASTNFENIDFSLPSDKEFNYKISSINVAGLRAFIEKGGLNFVDYEKPDILCLQETKCVEDQLPDAAKNLKGYHPYWLCKPGGHAGVALYSKVMPINVEYGIGDAEQDSDGRILTAEYEKFYLVCTYVPNAGRKLVSLDKRLRWNKLFEAHIKRLDAKKPVIVAGDMNVAHEEIDLANPKTNKRNAGFTQEERDGMTDLLKMGFVDTFRHFYPGKEKAYTFWTYMMNARAKNVGWRLDYFLSSERLVGKIVDNVMRNEVMGSDHCPITLFLKL